MKTLAFLLTLVFAAAASLARAEDPPVPDSIKTTQRPTIEALRAAAPPVIDGILSEDIWHRPGVTHFTQRDPVEGKTPSQKHRGVDRL